MQLLAQDPAARPVSATAVVEKLRAIQLTRSQPNSPPSRGHRAVVTGVVAGAVIAGAALAYVIVGGIGSTTREPPGNPAQPAEKNPPGPDLLPRVKLDLDLVRHDPDRAVARWALQHLKACSISINERTAININERTVVKGVDQLPDERFTLKALDFRGSDVTDTDLAQLSKVKLSRLVNVDLQDTKFVTKACLAHLVEIPLDDLQLSGCRWVTSTEAKTLGRMKTLVHLFLSDTGIDDGGLRHLTQLKALRYLSLSGTGITDVGLETLKELRNLKALHLERVAGITRQGVESLQKTLPGCRIEHGLSP
jgi:hypothetical protein